MKIRCSVIVAILVGLCVVTRASGVLPSTPSPTTRPVPQIRRVLLISIDGLRRDVLLRAEAPHVKALIDGGCQGKSTGGS